jgi:hypothetical protein
MAISAKERLPDSGALGLRICQANLPLLAPRIAYSSFTSISEKVRRMSVFPGKFFAPDDRFCCILPNPRAQTNLRQ